MERQEKMRINEKKLARYGGIKYVPYEDYKKLEEKLIKLKKQKFGNENGKFYDIKTCDFW